MNGDRQGSHAPARTTYPVSTELFQRVYDAPASLPGKHRWMTWMTSDEDVRATEKLLGVPEHTISAPLWVSGNTRHCPKCGRETNWLDTVSSALGRVYERAMIVRVIVGKKKYVNTEVPAAITNLKCHGCGTLITELRRFKCHNWAYAIGNIQKLIERMQG